MAIALMVSAAPLQADLAQAAAYETGSYGIYSPFGITKLVTSPARYHDGCPPDTSYYDSPKFDNGQCFPAVGVLGGGNWALDIRGSDNDDVWIDVGPSGIGSTPPGSTFRVVAGAQLQWDGSANGKYQIFGVHTWNPTLSVWENYAWIVVGHVDSLLYANGQTVIPSTTVRTAKKVAKVAPVGSWPEHLHVEVSNNFGGGYLSRAHDWDGPENVVDTVATPLCNRSGTPGPYNCNTEVRSQDKLGYIGGRWTIWLELDNPYYVGF